ncbi:MAG: hypothetical protein KKF41_16130 [Actinobacteria bacterium]|nr:hypothetical protein [Actinomycetota bacterium]MBU2689108.1 hypothetical protein [Actinomycetota bacterium]
MADHGGKNERNLDVVRMRREGITYLEIGKHFGISEVRVHQILKKYAPELTGNILQSVRQAKAHQGEKLVIDRPGLREPAIPISCVSEILAARELSLTCSTFGQIAAVLGVSRQRLRRWDSAYGIECPVKAEKGEDVPYSPAEVIGHLRDCGYSFREVMAITGWTKQMIKSSARDVRWSHYKLAPEFVDSLARSIVPLADAGMPQTEITRELGLKRSILRSVCSRTSIEFKRDGRFSCLKDEVQARNEAILEAFQSGKTGRCIAEEFGLSKAKVGLIRKGASIPPGHRAS